MPSDLKGHTYIPYIDCLFILYEDLVVMYLMGEILDIHYMELFLRYKRSGEILLCGKGR